VSSDNKKAVADYAVGYGRPPTQHRFKKGHPSANPAGRPKKGAKTAAKIADLLEEPVMVRINGRQQTIPYVEALVQVLKSRGLQHDAKAQQLAVLLLTETGALSIEPREPKRGIEIVVRKDGQETPAS
jgi:hypothetical protein